MPEVESLPTGGESHLSSRTGSQAGTPDTAQSSESTRLVVVKDTCPRGLQLLCGFERKRP